MTLTPEQRKEYAKKHYQENKDKYKERANKNRAAYVERNKEFVINWLQTHPCVDCGESDIIVLEFDHREPLRKTGSRVNNFLGNSLERLKAEIEKCDVVCANCHTRRTAKMMGWKRLNYM